MGDGIVCIDGKQRKIKVGDVITIERGCKHSVKALSQLDMIEVQLGEEVNVGDKIKCDME